MTHELKRIVIVGNGIAGLTAADTLRATGFDGELTIVGDERRPAYSRPALSKALLRDDVDLTAHELAAPDHGATELLGRSVAGLDPEKRLVRLDAGEALPYDGLVIATGSRARRLGGPESGELLLRTLDDALALRARIVGGPHVVIVGDGPLGMEAAAGAIEAGCRVTLVTRGAPMAAQLGEHLGRLLTESALAEGVELVTTPEAGVRVHDGRTSVVLADGRVIEGDLVLTAVGDIPNTEWLAGSGLTAHGPITVDSRGRVTERIVAAGDVAAVPTATGHARSPLWNSAIEQARVAARALLLGDAALELSAHPYFWTEQFGLSVRVAGRTPLSGEPELVDGDAASSSMLLRWRHDDGLGTAVAVNYRMPIPRLRALCAPAAAPAA